MLYAANGQRFCRVVASVRRAFVIKACKKNISNLNDTEVGFYHTLISRNGLFHLKQSRIIISRELKRGKRYEYSQ